MPVADGGALEHAYLAKFAGLGGGFEGHDHLAREGTVFFLDDDGEVLYELSMDHDASDIATVDGCLFDGPAYQRGDFNLSGSVSLVDALDLLEWGFNAGLAPRCENSADFNGDEVLTPIVDALYLLNYLFLGEDPPPYPFEFCDSWPTSLDCDEGCP